MLTPTQLKRGTQIPQTMTPLSTGKMKNREARYRSKEHSLPHPLKENESRVKESDRRGGEWRVEAKRQEA